MKKEENSFEYGTDEFVPIDSEVMGDNEVYGDILLNYGNCSIPSEKDRDKLAKHFETVLKIGMTAEEMDGGIREENRIFRKETDDWVDSHSKEEIRWE